MTNINMPRHRQRAFLMLFRRTMELLKPDAIYDLDKDRQWKFYYTVAMDRSKDRPEQKPS